MVRNTIYTQLDKHLQRANNCNEREELVLAAQGFYDFKENVRATDPYVFGNAEVAYRMRSLEAQLAQKRKLHEIPQA